jgi:hypothetical protein
MPARPRSVANNGTKRNKITPRNSVTAPRDPYRLPRPGSVANNGTQRNTFSKYNGNSEFKNSQGQLSAAQMNKISKLVKTTDTAYHKLVNMVKSKVCPRKPEELNLSLYSTILKDPRQSDEAKYDVMLQLVALKQIFKGERVVDKNTVSIFRNHERSLTIIAVVIGCIGFVMPLAAFGDMVAHVDTEYVSRAEEDIINEYKLLYPKMTEEEIKRTFSSKIANAHVKASLLSGMHERPISAALSSMGTGIIGFIPSLVSGIITAFVAPIPLTLIIGATKDAIRNVNLKMTVAEIEKIINDPENPSGLAESVENELKITAVEPPPPEQLEHISAPESAAPLQSMNEFMNRGVGANGLPPSTQTLSNFTRNAPAVRTAWGENNQKESSIKFSGVNNEFTHEAIAKENAESLVEARKGFSERPGLFTTAKGRQAQVNANNARLNAEWFRRNPKVSYLPEATRSAAGIKSALKKRGGRKTRRNRR